MRFRLSIFTLAMFSLFVAASAFAGENRSQGSRSDETQPGIASGAGEADFPHIAKNQTRPKPRIACVDPNNCDEIPPFDDGFTAGACNCARRCDSNHNPSVCVLASTTSGCKSNQYGGGCTDCTDCTW